MKLNELGKLHRSAYNRDILIKQIESKLPIAENSVVLLHGPAGCGKTQTDQSENFSTKLPLPVKLFENKNRIIQLYPLQEEELILLLKQEVDSSKYSYEKDKFDEKSIKFFAKLALKFTLSTSLRELRHQFRFLYRSPLASGEGLTQEHLFKRFSQQLNLDVADIEDSVDLKLTSLMSKIYRKIKAHLLYPVRVIADIVITHRSIILIPVMLGFISWITRVLDKRSVA